MIEVGRAEVQRLMAEAGAQLVDVLPEKEFHEEHLRGAVSLPLTELADRAEKDLDPDRPVIVYCYDMQCDLSPRAAWRLERLGFTQVHDYAAGRMDWAAAGLPVEGTECEKKRIGEVAHGDVPTCRPDDAVADALGDIGAWEVVVVLDERRVVLGVIPADSVGLEGSGAAEQVMKEGPSTYRPNVSVAELRERFDEHDVRHALVTTNSGELIGLIRRDDLD